MFSQHDPKQSPSMAGVSTFAPERSRVVPAPSVSQEYRRPGNLLESPFWHLSKANIKTLRCIMLINTCIIGHRDNLGHRQDYTM